MISISFWFLSIVIIIAAMLPDYFMMSMKAFGCRLGSLFPNPGEMTEKIRFKMQSKENGMENGVRTTTL